MGQPGNRGLLRITFRCIGRAESKRRWRTDKRRSDGTEDRGDCGGKNRQSSRTQNWRRRNRSGTESGMSGGANCARVVGCGRVLGMRVGGLDRPHHAHQGDREHAQNSDECAPNWLCSHHPQKVRPLDLLLRRFYPEMVIREKLIRENAAPRKSLPYLPFRHYAVYPSSTCALIPRAQYT